MNELQRFYDRLNAIFQVLRINSPELYSSLVNKAAFWAPEISPQLLTEWISQNFPINPNDPLTLTMYSLLTEKSIAVLTEQMELDLISRSKS